MLLFPDELLHTIAHSLAYIPEAADDSKLPEHLRFRCASPELFSLSLVNRRLRQICLPLLFAYLRIKSKEHAEEVRDSNFANSLSFKLARILTVEHVRSCEEEMHAILCKLLPHFQQLFGVDLTTWTPKIDLLKSLHEHPTISAVMIYSSAYLPPLSSGVDLSKIVLVRLHLRSFHDDMGNSLPDGLIAHRLVVREDETMRLDEEFSRLAFNGLRELKIYIRGSVSFSWLPTFTLAHPHLHKLLLKDDDFNHFRCHPPSFIGSFVEESKRQGLDEHFELGRVGLTRGTIQSTHEWRVTLISIYINAAFMGFLSLISSSLPTIEILHLNLTTLNRTYHIDDVVPAFAGFSHLRVLSLPHIIDRLQFGREEPWQPVRQVNENNTLETHAAAAETALLWFTSRLAKQVPSLEAFFIKERGSIEQGNGNERSWYLVGWLHVVSGRRDVEGSLRLITDGGRSFTVKTGSRLLADEMGERG